MSRPRPRLSALRCTVNVPKHGDFSKLLTHCGSNHWCKLGQWFPMWGSKLNWRRHKMMTSRKNPFFKFKFLPKTNEVFQRGLPPNIFCFMPLWQVNPALYCPLLPTFYVTFMSRSIFVWNRGSFPLYALLTPPTQPSSGRRRTDEANEPDYWPPDWATPREGEDLKPTGNFRRCSPHKVALRSVTMSTSESLDRMELCESLLTWVCNQIWSFMAYFHCGSVLRRRRC